MMQLEIKTKTHIYKDGCKYEGEWNGKRRHGKGIFEWPSGARYEGNYENNQRQGQGTLTYADGSVYSGTWN